MSIQIIQANSSHTPLISGIGRSSFHDAFSRLFRVPQDLEHYLDYTYGEEKIARSLARENNVYFLALDGTKAVGFAKLKKHSLASQIDSVWQSELQKIYVLPGAQGTGVGKALMQGVLKLMEQVQPEYLWLDVIIENDKARRFYEKTGFTRHGDHYFTIGSQEWKYDLMKMPIALPVALTGRKKTG